MPRDGSGTITGSKLEYLQTPVAGGISMTAREAWRGMIRRCDNPKTKQWKDYGGRGIAVRFASFDAFLAEVGERPPRMTIDRIDNDGDYAPGNVRWATRAEQQRNRRNTATVTVDGETYRVVDLRDVSGVRHDVIVNRARKGLPLSDVLSQSKLLDLSGLALGGEASGRKQRQRTHCSKGHKYTPENTYITPQGWRNCRTCHNAKMRARNRKT